jgi:CheY-like chemotaxis protein
MVHVPPIVLIAENDRDEVFLLQRDFSKTGLPYELRFVSNGREAIDYLSHTPPYDDHTCQTPFAVVLDLNMPIVDGFEVLEWMNCHPTFKDLPVIIHTTSDLPSDRQRAKQLGASAYIVKSLLASELGALFTTIDQSKCGPRSSATSTKRGA